MNEVRKRMREKIEGMLLSRSTNCSQIGPDMSDIAIKIEEAAFTEIVKELGSEGDLQNNWEKYEKYAKELIETFLVGS
ncbi:hypothetical protein HK098_007326 [Nowakowskiella sp. JEL0407]|nr:hypothetical protein HK098_007317 [Nowakowskiella sp. JEL0407]KAJ3126649.1 hypothetical protein HK098_007326 [Nowakowskiella sp. JEL0407]